MDYQSHTNSLKRIAMLSVHTCPLATLGGKHTGGMNVYVRDLSRTLGARGYHVDIFTRCESKTHPHIIHMDDMPNVRVIHVCAGPDEPQEKNKLFQYLPEFTWNVLDFADLEGCAYDVIHSHYWMSGWVARELRKVWGAPIIQMFHTLGHMKNLVARADEPREHERRISIETELLRDADRIVAATQRDQAQMVTWYNADATKMRVIPCGVDLSRFHPYDQKFARREISLDLDVKNVLFVGRMEPLKGIDDLLRAIARIVRDNDMPCNGLSLSIVGGSSEYDDDIPAEMAHLMRLRDELGLNDLVTFLGAQGQDVLPLYYAAADVVVMPSHYESFGMVALEAMACGTPVVASDVGGLSFTVADGVTGYLVPARDPDALAERICDILNDPLHRDELGHSAMQAAQQYGWERIADQIETLYDEVTA
jgi:D-inositol-3-phosphate glycosyltransferase